MGPTAQPHGPSEEAEHRIPIATAEELPNARAVILSGAINGQTDACRYGCTTVTTAHMYTLRPGAWLNDEVINAYMHLLQMENRRLHETSAVPLASLFLQSHFMTKLRENNRFTYSNVLRWTRTITTFALDRIYMPIHRDRDHWAMLVITIPDKNIQYYDSLNRCGSVVVEAAQAGLGEEARTKNHPQHNPSEWSSPAISPVSPQQTNGHDCGVYSILCADYLSNNKPLSYEPADMPAFRLKIAAAILRGRLISAR